jgi:hypothetical protein
LQDEMPDLQPQTDTNTINEKPAPDALAGLYHMSNTAGVSTQEYVAINPTAIAALLLGFASVLIVLSNMLLIVPIIGVICGIVAIVQIRHSNQTQTGRGLATLGLLLSLFLGGGKIAYDGLASFRRAGDQREIAEVTRQLSQDLVAKDYEHAYGRFTDAFKQRVPLPTFEQGMKGLESVPSVGALSAVEWNRQRMEITEKPDTGLTDAYSMTLFKYGTNPQPRRIVIMFEKSGNVWHLHDIPSLFETKKK